MDTSKPVMPSRFTIPDVVTGDPRQAVESRDLPSPSFTVSPPFRKPHSFPPPHDPRLPRRLAVRTFSLKTNARAVKVGARPKPTTATVERAANAAGKKKTTTMPTDDQVSSREESDSTDRPTSTTFGFLRCILCPRGCSGLVSFLLFGQGVPLPLCMVTC